jgi:hypothetical protein
MSGEFGSWQAKFCLPGTNFACQDIRRGLSACVLGTRRAAHGRHHGRVEILLWLLPAVVVTCAAMVWVSWIGRERPERERSVAEQERCAEAVMRPVPDERRRPRQRERSTGVAQRRDDHRDNPRRSA